MEILRARFSDYCSQLNVNGQLLTSASHTGASHVEKVGEIFHWVVTERGTEFQRKTTTSREEVLYWLVDGVVSRLSIDYELQHRIHGQDCRRVMFEYQIKRMHSLSPLWGERITQELAQVLERHPYNDRQ